MRWKKINEEKKQIKSESKVQKKIEDITTRHIPDSKYVK